MRGEVVGINSQIYSRTGGFMGLSFAIPIDVAMDVQAQLRASGRVQRGRIGVVIQEVSKELADSFGLKSASGALVNSVEKGGPAEKAGVEVGDIITKYDGKPVGSSSDLPRMVGGTKPGAKATMEVWRKGASQNMTVVVGELPEDRVASRIPTRPRQAEQQANRLGFVVNDLTPEQRRDMRLNEAGVIVEDVRQTVRADVRPGDVITAVTSRGQTTELRSADQFNKLLSQIDRNQTMTLHVRRGESNLFVPIRGEPAPPARG
jgi:serine protease Do